MEIPDFYFTEKTNLVNLPTLPKGEYLLQVFDSVDNRPAQPLQSNNQRFDTSRNFRVSTKQSANVDYNQRRDRNDIFDQFDNTSEARGRIYFAVLNQQEITGFSPEETGRTEGTFPVLPT